MRELLLPQTTISRRTAWRRGASPTTDDDDDAALAIARSALIEMGCEYVLVTGTHEPTPRW